MNHRSLLRLLGPLVLLLAVTSVPVTGMHEEDGDPASGILDARPLEQPTGEASESHRGSRHQVVFIHQDGEVQELEGEGEAFGWIAADSPHRRFRFHMPALPLRRGGYLGVATTSMTPELRLHFGAPEGAGLLISEVVDGSPAFAAGLRVGDILTRVDGEPIRHHFDLLRQIRRREEGESVSLDIVRDGKAEQIVAVLDRVETSDPASFGWAYRFDCEDEGDCSSIELDLCPEGSECRIEVECDGDACVCEVDGRSVECRDLEGPHTDHD